MMGPSCALPASLNRAHVGGNTVVAPGGTPVLAITRVGSRWVVLAVGALAVVALVVVALCVAALRVVVASVCVSQQHRTPRMVSVSAEQVDLPRSTFVLPPVATCCPCPHGLWDQTTAKSSMQPVPFARSFESSVAVQRRAPTELQVRCAVWNDAGPVHLLVAHLSWYAGGANRQECHPRLRHDSTDRCKVVVLDVVGVVDEVAVVVEELVVVVELVAVVVLAVAAASVVASSSQYSTGGELHPLSGGNTSTQQSWLWTQVPTLQLQTWTWGPSRSQM